MAHGERAARLRQSQIELWSRRPLAGWPCTADVRRLSRKLERHRQDEDVRREVEKYYDDKA